MQDIYTIILSIIQSIYKLITALGINISHRPSCHFITSLLKLLVDVKF